MDTSESPTVRELRKPLVRTAPADFCEPYPRVFLFQGRFIDIHGSFLTTCVILQSQLGRRHSPGFPLPPFQPERIGASRSNSNCETLPEEDVEGGNAGPFGPMGSREVLLQVWLSFIPLF